MRDPIPASCLNQACCSPPYLLRPFSCHPQVDKLQTMNSVAFAGLVGDDMGPLTTHAAQSLLSCRASPPPFAVVVEQARQSLPHLQSRLFGMRQAAASKPPSQPRPLLDDACASTNLALAGLNALLSSQGFGLSQAEIISNLPGATVESIEPLLAAISGLPGGALFDEWSVFRQQRGHPFPVDPLSIIASQSKAGCGVANIFPCGSLARSVWSSGPIPDPCLTASDPADISNVITITFKADVSTSALPCSACDGVFSSPQPVCILLHFLPDSTIPEYVQVSAGDTATGPFTECRTIHIVPQSVSSQTGVNVGVVRAHYALINFSAVRPTAPRYYRVAMCGAVDSTPGITSPEYALSSLEFLCQPAILPPLVSTRDVVVTIQSWLTRMFTTTKPGPIRSKLLQAMVSFAGVTGECLCCGTSESSSPNCACLCVCCGAQARLVRFCGLCTRC